MDGKSISGMLKLTALLVCLSFMFSGAMSAFQDSGTDPEEGSGPVTAKDSADEGGEAVEAPEPEAESPVEPDIPWYGEPNQRGNDIFVPGSYWYIGDAVAAASPWDRILVNEPLLWDAYDEDMMVVDKPLTIQGMGADVVTIEGNWPDPFLFDVQSDNVVIEGFTLEPARSGIRVNDSYLVNITDCIIDPNYYGDGIAALNGSTDVRVENVTINCARTAIALNDTTDCDILDNTLYDQRMGVVVHNSSSALVEGNMIIDTWYGYDGFWSRDLWLTEGVGILAGPNTWDVDIGYNTITGSDGSGIAVNGSGLDNTYNIDIYDNEVTDSGFFGINITNFTHDIYIDDNRVNVTQPVGSYLDHGTGISVRNATNANVQDNSLRDHDYGIALRNGTDESFVGGNTVYDCMRDGILLQSISHPASPPAGSRSGEPLIGFFSIEVEYNEIFNCGWSGVTLLSSDWTYLGHNRIHNNTDFGIFMAKSTNNTLDYNTIHSTMGSGVGVFMLSQSNNNTFYENDVRFNHDTGMFLFMSENNTVDSCHVNANGLSQTGWGPSMGGTGIALYQSKHTTVMDTHISNPVTNARDSYMGMQYDPNTWSGNYYGNYTGVDTDGDQVGEEDYIISGMNWASFTKSVDTTPRTKVIVEGTPNSTMMIGAAVNNTEMEDGTLGHWKFNETGWSGTPDEVRDHSFMTDGGTAYNGADTVPGGRLGRAGQFDGIDDYVDTESRPATQVRTVEAWIMPNVTDYGGGILAEFLSQWGAGGPGNAAWNFYLSEDKLTFAVYDGADGTTVSTSYTDTTRWHHVAGVYNNNLLSLYIDGALAAGPVFSFVPQVSTNYNIFIGRAPVMGGGSTYYNGSLDDVRMYDRTLGPAEIENHSRGYFGKPSTITIPATMDGYYYESVKVENRYELALQGGGGARARGYDGYYTDLPNVTCQYEGNSNATFWLNDSADITVDGILTYGGRVGFSWNNVMGAVLTDSVAYNTSIDEDFFGGAGAFMNNTPGAQVDYNRFIGNHRAGLRMENASDATVMWNHCDANGLMGNFAFRDGSTQQYPWASGLVMLRSENATVTWNQALYNTGHGILVEEGHGTIIGDNNASGNKESYRSSGIAVQDSRDVTITKNIADGNEYGIWVAKSSDRTEIVDNTANMNADTGIMVTDSMVFELTDNLLDQNEEYGIYYDFLYTNWGPGRSGVYEDYARNRWSFQYPQPLNMLRNTVTGDYSESTDMDGIYVANVGRQSAHNSTMMWYSGTGQSYQADMNITVDLAGMTNPYLEFYQYYDLADSNDYIFVNVSDDGIYYKWNLYTQNGEGMSDEWERKVIDLSDFVGMKIWLRFQYITDLFASPNPEFWGGWWLDDVRVYNATEKVAFYDNMEPAEAGYGEYETYTLGGTSMSFSTYGNSGSGLKVENYKDGEWSLEGTYMGTNMRWVKQATHDAKRLVAVAGLDNSNRLDVIIFDGKQWSDSHTLTTNTYLDSRPCFDLAFEHDSGELLVVWGDGSGSDWTMYATWSKTGGWSSSDIVYTGSNYCRQVRQVRMAADPTSDEIMVVTTSGYSGARLYSHVWNGGGWSYHTDITGSIYQYDYESFDVAYESLSGEAHLVWSYSSGYPYHYYWTGSGWSSLGQLGGDTYLQYAYHVELESDPNSDAIAIGIHSPWSTDRAGFYYWSGTAISSSYITGGNMYNTFRDSFDVGFDPVTGDMIVVNSNTNYGYYYEVQTYVYSPGSGWTYDWYTYTNPYYIYYLELEVSPVSGGMNLYLHDNQQDLRVLEWKDGNWQLLKKLTSSLYTSYRCWVGGLLSLPPETVWEHGAPSGVGPSSPPPSGDNLWGTDLDADYKSNHYTTLTTPVIDLSGGYLEAPVLTFKHWLEVEGGCHDGGVVEIMDEAHDWTPLDPGNDQGQYDDMIDDANNPLDGRYAFCMNTTGWENASFVLPDWATGSERVALRFIFASDMDGGVAAGWYIDDLEITYTGPDEGMMPLDDDLEDGGDDAWTPGNWMLVGRSLVFEDNVVQGTDRAVELISNGATAFNRNNLSYNRYALDLWNGDTRRGPDGGSKNWDDIYVFDMEFTHNDISHNTGDGDIVDIHQDTDRPSRWTFEYNNFTYNNYDVLDFNAYDAMVYISSISWNNVSYNMQTGGGEPRRAGGGDVRRGFEFDLYAEGDGGMEIGEVTNNVFIRDSYALDISVDGRLTIDTFTYNRFVNLFNSGNIEFRAPEDEDLDTYTALDIETDYGHFECPDMSNNLFKRTEGAEFDIDMDAMNTGDSYLNFHDNTLVMNGDYYTYDEHRDGSAFEMDVYNGPVTLEAWNNTFDHNGDGMNLYFDTYDTATLNIYDNTFNNNSDEGLEIDGNSDAFVTGVIENNFMEFNGRPHDTDSSRGGADLYLLNTDMVFTGNTLSDNYGYGLRVDTDDVPVDLLIMDNDILDNLGYWSDGRGGDWDWISGGLYLRSAAGVTVWGNRVNGNNGSNMVIENSYSITVDGDNEFSDAVPFFNTYNDDRGTRGEWYDDGFGIVVYDSYECLINMSDITGNTADGIYVDDSWRTVIGNNTISGNGYDGIYCVDSWNLDISNNTITDNGMNGFYELDNYGCRLADNNITENALSGFWSQSTDGNEYWFVRNTISGNGQHGIYFGYPQETRGGYHNGEWYDMEIWMEDNHIFNNDGWGVLIDDYMMYVYTRWDVSGSASLINNPAYLADGEIIVRPGGVFTVNGAELYFAPDFGMYVLDGGTLNAYDTELTHAAFLPEWDGYGGEPMPLRRSGGFGTRGAGAWTNDGYWYLVVNGSATFSDCSINYTYTIDAYNAGLLTLTRTNVSMTQGHGITMENCYNTRIDFSHIHHTGGNGVDMLDSMASMDSTWISYAHDGIHAQSSMLDLTGSCRIFNNSGSGDGIDVYLMDVVNVDGAVIYNNMDHGMRIRDSNMIMITDCVIFNNGGDGIFLTSSGIEGPRVVTSDNLIYACDAGITATKGSYLDSDRDTLTGNDDGYNILDNSQATSDDSTLANDVLDLFVTDGSHFVVTNTTHDEAKATVQNTGLGTGTLLEVRWYITVAVYDLGAPVSGANVTFNQSLPYPAYPGNYFTGGNGQTKPFVCTGYVMTYNNKDTSMNPHEVAAEIEMGSGTEIVTDTFNANMTKTVVVGVNLPPEGVGQMGKVSFNEGKTFKNAIDLDIYFFDREELEYTVSGNTYVTALIHENGLVDLSTSDPDWHGDETLTFTATDSLGQADTQKLKVTVNSINDLPWLENVVIVPEGPRTGDHLQISYEWYDVDTEYEPGDNESAPTIRWYRNGLMVTDHYSAVLIPSSATKKGDVWYAVVTPRDLLGENGTSVTSGNATIRNTPPSVRNATLDPDEVYVTTDVTVEPDGWSDADNDAPGYKYQWQIDRNGVWEDIATQRTSRLPAGFFAKDERVRCEVTPYDGQTAGTPIFSEPATVLNSPPEVLLVEIEPGWPSKTQTLTAVANATMDADGDPVVSYNFTWYVNGDEVPGENGARLHPSWFTTDDEVHVGVTASDGEDSGLPAVSEPVLITNTPPTIASVMLSPANPDETDNITALPQLYFDADGDPAQTPDVTWYINSRPRDDVIGDTLLPAYFEKGDVIFAVVKPFDGDDHGPGVASSSVKITAKLSDTDDDGVSDQDDIDIDDDGIPNENDQFPFNGSEWGDMDGDGIGDNADTDADGDGIPNGEDDFPGDPDEVKDTDGDGIGDNADSDIDGDGVPNEDDEDPYDASRDESINEAQGRQTTAFNLALILLLIFLIVILLLFWMSSRRRDKAAVANWEEAGAKGDEDFSSMSKCSECEAIIPADADACPECGADFSEEEEDEEDEGDAGAEESVEVDEEEWN